MLGSHMGGPVRGNEASIIAMAILYLVRHAATDLIGHTLAGRARGVNLNAIGREQAQRLAQHFESKNIKHIFSSPLERACQTAEPVARKLGLQIEIEEAFNEIDFGDWTGRTVAQLESIELWRQWNLFRSTVRIPHGELMVEVQSRVVRRVEQLQSSFPDESIVVVSHADTVKAAVIHFLGMPLDMLQRLDISPASVSVLDLQAWGSVIRSLNFTM